MRSLLRFAFVLVALVAAGCGPNAATTDSAQPPNPLVVASQNPDVSGPCPCPQLPTVPRSAQPDPGGYAIGELGSDDLEAALSNRDYNYGLDWEQTTADLTNRIDPNGAYGLGPVPVSRVNADEELKEGFISGAFLNGPDYRHFVPHYKGHRDWSTDLLNDQKFFRQLVITVARANRYGEREAFGRRKALEIAQWFADLLPQKRDYLVDARSQYMFPLTEAARANIASYVAVTGLAAARMPKIYGQPFVANVTYYVPAGTKPSEFPLDAIDMANAAMDVIEFDDGNGPRLLRIGFPYGPTNYVPNSLFNQTDIGGRSIVASLISLAAQRSVYGGPAIPGSRLDDIACKAFNLLLTLTDQEHAHSDLAREEVMTVLDQIDVPVEVNPTIPDPLTLTAMRSVIEAVMLATRFTPAEGNVLAQQFDHEIREAASSVNAGSRTGAETARASQAQLAWLVPFAKELTGVPPAGVPDAGRAAYAQQIDASMAQFTKVARSWDAEFVPSSLVGSDGAVALWNATRVTLSSGPVNVAVCSNGSCTTAVDAEPSVDTNASGPALPQVVIRSQLLPQAADTADSLAADEPFTIIATIRRDRANAIGDYLTVDVSGVSAGSTSVVLKRIGSYDKTLGAYASLAPLTFEAGGEGATSGTASAIVNWAIRKFRGYGTADMAKLRVTDGELVTFRVHGEASSPATLVAYTTDARQQIGRNEHNFTNLAAVFNMRVNDPTLDVQSRSLYQIKLALIANARKIVAHVPTQDEDFNDLSRAEIGMAYAGMAGGDVSQLGNEGVDQFGVTSPVPAGEDARFGVTYLFGAERSAVREALREAHDKTSVRAYHGIGRGEIALYDAYLSAQCDVIKRLSADLAPCPEELWILASSTTADGVKVSGWGRAMVAKDLIWQAIQHTEEYQALYDHIADRIDSAFDRALGGKRPIPTGGSTSAAASTAGSDTVPTERRSEEVEEELVGNPTGAGIGEVPVDPAELQIGSALPAATGASGAAAFPSSRLPRLTSNRPIRAAIAGATEFVPPNKQRFLQQFFDNTCFLTVVRWLRARKGLANVSESEFAAKAAEFTAAWNLANGRSATDGGAYNFDGGSTSDGVKRFLRAMGADARNSVDYGGAPIGVSGMKQALRNGLDVVATVTRTMPDGTTRGHAVAVIQITDGQVIYGDPWSGKFWTIDECSFDASIAKGATLLINWGAPGS